MKRIKRFAVLIVLSAVCLPNALPCGPGYVTPLFDTSAAPESPYVDYAAGRLGIIKPTFRRSILYAAYRYVAGSGVNALEQRAMIEVWKAEIDNKDFRDDSVDEAVKAWVEKRKSVVGADEKVPDIYAERDYGGYDFFPNCSRNAFETALETLTDRASSHGSSDPNVLNWIRAQDQVFQNCSSGKQRPDEVPVGAPSWLVKDRAYQTAAAAFYSLAYDDARKQFEEIAQDPESPWQETADYLVARTLIRQASLSKATARTDELYDRAETHLERFVSRSGKFASSAEKLTGLIKYRRHPKERVNELARKLAFNGGNENFQQDLIDYNWLLDKFQTDVLTQEEKRKEEEKRKSAGPGVNSSAGNDANAAANTLTNSSFSSNKVTQGVKKNETDITIYLSNDDYSQSWVIYVDRDATDDEALAAAEKLVGKPLTPEMIKRVKDARRSGYIAGFTEGQRSGYEGGYYGEEALTPGLIPVFLKQSELTDWLYVFQMNGAEPYLYSLNKFVETGSELWLMTALSKADRSSTQLPRLMEAAKNSSRTSPAYPTVAYHHARLLIITGKNAEARTLIDEMLNFGDALPTSARNSFIGLRLKTVETMEEYLKYSLKKPYGFDFDGETGNIADIIAERKKEYDPEYNKDGREAFEKEIEESLKEEALWQDRSMFDEETIEAMNQHFPTATLIEVMRSPSLPDYIRERFATAIWTRSYLLDNVATLLTVTPDVARYHPELEPMLSKITTAKTQPAIDAAILYFVLKNPIMTPYLEDGIGRSDNEAGDFDSNDWWCQPYDMEYSDETNAEVPKSLPPRPKFLTAAQSSAAQSERKRLKEIGDAPHYLGAKVQEWAKRNPADKRVPEALYIMARANGWTKYGCGNNEELREALMEYLRKRYPNSEWTVKLTQDESEK